MFTASLKQLLFASSLKNKTSLQQQTVKELGKASLLTLGAPGNAGEGQRQTRPRFIPVPGR